MAKPLVAGNQNLHSTSCWPFVHEAASLASLSVTGGTRMWHPTFLLAQQRGLPSLETSAKLSRQPLGTARVPSEAHAAHAAGALTSDSVRSSCVGARPGSSTKHNDRRCLARLMLAARGRAPSVAAAVPLLFWTACNKMLSAKCFSVKPLLCGLLHSADQQHVQLGATHRGSWVPTAPSRQFTAQASSQEPSSKPQPTKAASSRPRQPRLVQVDGLGRKYEGLLQQQGINTVDKLAEVLLDRMAAAGGAAGPAKHHSSSSSQHGSGALEYLKEVVGIRRADHATKIIRYIQLHYGDSTSTAAAAGGGGQQQQQQEDHLLTFCVEGNISAGKSTFLNYIRQDNELLAGELEVVPEPVAKWQDVRLRSPTGGSTRLDLLSQFYGDPAKYAFPFQNYVFMSRFQQEMDSSNTSFPVRLMERSIFSDRLVFVRAVYDNGWMGDVEVAVYDSMFDPILESRPSLVPDGFIYLKCDPEVCMERVKLRSRGGEDGITLDYLRGLHAKHEDWLGLGVPATSWLDGHHLGSSSSSSLAGSTSAGAGGLYLPGGPFLADFRSSSSSLQSSSGAGAGLAPSMTSSSSSSSSSGWGATAGGLAVPGSIDSNLYVLNSNPVMHEALVGVPALVLDCSQDVLHNRELREEFQHKVQSYIQFMREFRRAKLNTSCAASGDGSGSWAGGNGPMPAGVVSTSSDGGSSSSRGGGPGTAAPGTPSREQEQGVRMVQEAARGMDGGVKAVPTAPGGVLDEEQAAAVEAASGALEALTMAQHQQQQQQLQEEGAAYQQQQQQQRAATSR